MNRFPFLFLILVIISLMTSACLAEEIYAISENSFETEELTLIIPTSDFEAVTDFTFRSSPALRGRVEILSTDENEIEIVYRKVLFANSLEDAKSFAEVIGISYTQSGNIITISADAPRDAPWRRTANLSGQVECEIYLPEKFSLNLDLIGYYVNVKGPFPEAEISGEYCDEIRVSKIELGLKIDANNSTLILRDINGPILIEGEGASITARNIDSGLGIASFENNQGSISVIGYSGDELRCIGDDGKISLEKLVLIDGSRVYVSNTGINSDVYIDVEQLQDSHLEVYNKEADITLLLPKQLEAEFEITADPDKGEIEFSGIPLVTQQVDWGKLLAHTKNSNSRIVIDARGTGKINIRRKDF